MTAENFKDVVTAIVLIAGAIGAAWKWVFAEMLRRQNEIPTLDEQFAARCEPLDAENTAVEFCSTWRNKGTVPVFTNCKTTNIRIFRLADAENGIEKYWDDLEPFKELKPLDGMSFYFLEPGTDSQVQTIASLPNDELFLARFELAVPIPDRGRPAFLGAMKRYSQKVSSAREVVFCRIALFRTLGGNRPEPRRT